MRRYERTTNERVRLPVLQMVNVALSLAQVVVALALVVLNGFFVAAEFAFVRIRETSVEQLAEEGRPGAGTLQEVMVNLDDYLATTQLGITIASLGLGWVGEPAVASLIEPVLAPILPTNLIHLVAFAIGFSLITFLHVVFGELAPKTLAIARTERLSLFLAPPMKVFYYVLYPGIVVFNGAANAFTRALGVPPASETDETLGERELLRVLTRSGEKGDIDVAEVKMIERVFDLDDIVVREVMVPRPDVVSVPADASLSDLQSIILEADHTRYPVLDADDGDQVIGFVDVKDVLRAEMGDAAAQPAFATDPNAAAGVGDQADVLLVAEVVLVLHLAGDRDRAGFVQIDGAQARLPVAEGFPAALAVGAADGARQIDFGRRGLHGVRSGREEADGIGSGARHGRRRASGHRHTAFHISAALRTNFGHTRARNLKSTEIPSL